MKTAAVDEVDDAGVEERVDVRVPVTVVFDLSIHSLKREEVEGTIERLREAVIAARLEGAITKEFEELRGAVGGFWWGSRFVPVETGEPAFRASGESGGFK